MIHSYEDFVVVINFFSFYIYMYVYMYKKKRNLMDVIAFKMCRTFFSFSCRIYLTSLLYKKINITIAQ